MNNIEEKLNSLRIKNLSEDEKNSLWHNIAVRHVEVERKKTTLSFNIFNMKKLIVGLMVLVFVLGGSGIVAASNSAVPGNTLFPVKLAVENLRIKLASADKKEELKLKFASAHVEEIKALAEQKGASALVVDLSASSVSSIEADIFTNETLVKIEANNKNYGFITTNKTEASIISEIATKYSLKEEDVKSKIKFSTENRESRADDKGFLNKTNSVKFSVKEDRDMSLVLTDISKLLDDSSDPLKKEEIKAKLNNLLVLLGDDSKIRIEKKGDSIKIDSSIKIEDKTKKSKENNSDESHGNGKGEDDKIFSGDQTKDDSNEDKIEDDNKIFCRGEWREEDDCTISINGNLNINSGKDDGDSKDNELEVEIEDN